MFRRWKSLLRGPYALLKEFPSFYSFIPHLYINACSSKVFCFFELSSLTMSAHLLQIKNRIKYVYLYNASVTMRKKITPSHNYASTPSPRQSFFPRTANAHLHTRETRVRIAWWTTYSFFRGTVLVIFSQKSTSRYLVPRARIAQRRGVYMTCWIIAAVSRCQNVYGLGSALGEGGRRKVRRVRSDVQTVGEAEIWLGNEKIG